jgi:hypothetical protein
MEVNGHVLLAGGSPAAPGEMKKRFEWNEVTKVSHYHLTVDTLTQPMQVCEGQAPYGGTDRN